jgi:hypothetical protein
MRPAKRPCVLAVFHGRRSPLVILEVEDGKRIADFFAGD